ncbi:MAG: cold shock domain-containing protein, partial [Marinovum sp.]|nr:cold shock domain-containing protein [Marinovum sp.]
ADFEDIGEDVIKAAVLEPARVKWFDKIKGFGFATIFKRPEDVFLHIEVLRQSGLSDLAPGEALAVKAIDGKRGRMAVEIRAWDLALNDS